MYSKLTLSKDLQPTQKDLDGLQSVLHFKATADQLKDLYTLLYAYGLPYDTINKEVAYRRAVYSILNAITKYPVGDTLRGVEVKEDSIYMYVYTQGLETEEQTDQLLALIDKVRLGFNSILYLN